jgi:hypothetical protein
MINFSLEATIAPSRPVGNRIIFVTVSGIRALDGSALNGAVTTHFTTAFSPFYSNVMRVRLIAGEFLTDVPDDTVNQLVQYFSRQADLMNFCPDVAAINPTTYASYRSRWVTASVIVSLLSGSSINAMMQKRLGDFMVKRDKAAQDLYKGQLEELRQLTDILQDGGFYGRTLDVAVKGINNPDTPDFGRLWARPENYTGQVIPAANSRGVYARSSDGAAQRRSKKNFRDRY